MKKEEEEEEREREKMGGLTLSSVHTWKAKQTKKHLQIFIRMIDQTLKMTIYIN